MTSLRHYSRPQRQVHAHACLFLMAALFLACNVKFYRGMIVAAPIDALSAGGWRHSLFCGNEKVKARPAPR